MDKDKDVVFGPLFSLPRFGEKLSKVFLIEVECEFPLEAPPRPRATRCSGPENTEITVLVSFYFALAPSLLGDCHSLNEYIWQ